MLQIPLWHKSRTKIVGTLNANVPFRASLFPPYVVYCDSVYTNIEGTRRYKNVPTILTETVDMFGSTCPVFVILPDSWPVRNFFVTKRNGQLNPWHFRQKSANFGSRMEIWSCGVVERQSFHLWDQSFSHVAKSGEIQEDIGHHRLCQSWDFFLHFLSSSLNGASQKTLLRAIFRCLVSIYLRYGQESINKLCVKRAY